MTLVAQGTGSSKAGESTLKAEQERVRNEHLLLHPEEYKAGYIQRHKYPWNKSAAAVKADLQRTKHKFAV
jgi:hypothetical protein